MLAPAVVLPGWFVNASAAAGPGVMLNVPLVALVRPVLAARSVYPVPVLLIDRSVKLATPFTALTVNVPLSVPPPGFAAIATAIAAVLVVTVLPPASCTVTWTPGGLLMPTPATVFVGWLVNARRAAGPTRMLNGLLMAPVRPVLEAVSVYPVPALSMESALKVATPFTALTVRVPLNVPPPGFAPITRVIEAALLVTVLPNA